MRKYLLTVAEGIQVEITATSFKDAHKEFEAVKAEVAAEKVKIVRRPIAKTDRPGLRDRVLELKEQSFFEKPRTFAGVREKLAELALHYPVTSIPSALNPLVQEGLLRRTREERDGKEVWVYHE